MKNIVVFGAGKSSTFLIDYLIDQLPANQWKLTVLDADLKAAQTRTSNAAFTEAYGLNAENEKERKSYIAQADIVISLLPPTLHYLVALDCIEYGKNLLTASYIDSQIEHLRTAIQAKGLLFLCEMGLDPGIDHMSAMRIIDRLRILHAKVDVFRSHCGGLVAPESDDNPWRYKVTWNPRNVILAGKSGAVYKENTIPKQLSYEQLFDPERTVNINALGPLSYYPNRDSLPYIELYALQDANDFIRTTLRYPEFIAGWKNIIRMKLTDETSGYDTDGKTLKAFFEAHFKEFNISVTDYPEMNEQLVYLGISDELTVINRGRQTAAEVLQFVLEKKLALKPADKDMIVMLHEIEYTLNSKQHYLKSSLIVKGTDAIHTAMAKTVGLPLGIAAKLILQGKITAKGLRIPVTREIYGPVLAELETLGILFMESDSFLA